MTARGAVAQASGGTMFLDEIAEMAPDMQTKLLRFLQNLTYRKVGGSKDEKANVRIICATNKDPLEEIRSGSLRQDLYYRLHVVPVHMPPLRQRRNDIIDLADYFLKLYSREEGKSFRSFSPEAERIMTGASWPGNVRQLQNIVRGIAVLHDGKIVTSSMLPPSLRESGSAAKSAAPDKTRGDCVFPLWQVERDAIESAIALCEGNIPKAAAMLEISPSTIYRKKMQWDKHPPLSPPGGAGAQPFQP
ncbi:MAG TPA: sigma 54-interacting transcriptional regulator [Micavibrio sp.]|nr:sigma 54-interacting transcriptional regulator [Micavibrio sp.]